MRNRNILICGAGIAGPTLAYWLLKWGFVPTLLERAPALRTSGYMIDFAGVGYDVAERMGVLDALRRHAYPLHMIRLVDRRGHTIGSVSGQVYESAVSGRSISLLRGDLAREIYSAIEGNVEIIFGDTIRSIEQDDERVDVTFEHSAARRFDLVIGADGLHSSVRRAVFGDEQQFERYLGYCVGAFTAEGYAHQDPNVYIGYNLPGRQVWRFSLRDDRTAFTFIFTAAPRPDVTRHGRPAYQAMVQRAYANAGWESDEILAAMHRSADLYFDAVSQIHVPTWSSGRVALVGDSCCAPSLVSGQGAAFAMGGAYCLAGELKVADGDFARAFHMYEARFKPFVDGQQKAALRTIRWYAPRTAFDLWVRNAAVRLIALPTVSTQIGKRLVNIRCDLPDYGVEQNQPMRAGTAAR